MVVGGGLVRFPSRGFTLVSRVLLGFPYYLDQFAKIHVSTTGAPLPSPQPVATKHSQKYVHTAVSAERGAPPTAHAASTAVR